jgi:hypothetical protein
MCSDPDFLEKCALTPNLIAARNWFDDAGDSREHGLPINTILTHYVS